MKKKTYVLKMLILQFCICMLPACFSTPPAPSTEAVIQFDEYEHSFGTLPFKKESGYSFQFTNPGKIPLVISDVKTSCGCTVPEWPRKPVKPGSTGKIKISYDAASPGAFSKEISVHYNGKGSPEVLRIKGQVEYPLMENSVK